ncbi:MAG: GNAT family N-acetyltransferase [Planctomycetota bacterium]
MQEITRLLPEGYSLRLMLERDYPAISAICEAVYPTERPYTSDELAAHHRVFPEGQFVVVHDNVGAVVGTHCTLLLRITDFYLDDSWDVLTSGGSFTDHDPAGHTLYGADLMVHPAHQHHGIGRALTVAARVLVREKGLWRSTGGSRLPGFHRFANVMSAEEYIAAVKRGEVVDSVLTAHLHDGWDAVTAIQGYLPNDGESVGWAAVIQWINPDCPPPAGHEITQIARRKRESNA